MAQEGGRVLPTALFAAEEVGGGGGHVLQHITPSQASTMPYEANDGPEL